MGREDLADDPRFATNAARAANMDAVDALVAGLDRAASASSRFSRPRSGYRIPCAPVRDVAEVMDDPHMHERGFLEHFDHPEFGDVVLPGSPLRLHGAGKVATTAEPDGRAA